VIPIIPWTKRTWSFTLPIGAFPAIVERLRGTPARAAELVAGVPDEVTGRSPNSGWSVKQHIGHLDDLHELDLRRLDEFLGGAAVLSAADMTNRRTKEADHNAVPAEVVVERLRNRRMELVTRMETLTESQIGATATHPRLGQRVRLIDWASFVADHDDHHLASARSALSTPGPAKSTRAH
jgi:hypothetical protein